MAQGHRKGAVACRARHAVTAGESIAGRQDQTQTRLWPFAGKSELQPRREDGCPHSSRYDQQRSPPVPLRPAQDDPQRTQNQQGRAIPEQGHPTHRSGQGRRLDPGEPREDDCVKPNGTPYDQFDSNHSEPTHCGSQDPLAEAAPFTTQLARRFWHDRRGSRLQALHDQTQPGADPGLQIPQDVRSQTCGAHVAEVEIEAGHRHLHLAVQAAQGL